MCVSMCTEAPMCCFDLTHVPFISRYFPYEPGHGTPLSRIEKVADTSKNAQMHKSYFFRKWYCQAKLQKRGVELLDNQSTFVVFYDHNE